MGFGWSSQPSVLVEERGWREGRVKTWMCGESEAARSVLVVGEKTRAWIQLEDEFVEVVVEAMSRFWERSQRTMWPLPSPDAMYRPSGEMASVRTCRYHTFRLAI